MGKYGVKMRECGVKMRECGVKMGGVWCEDGESVV